MVLLFLLLPIAAYSGWLIGRRNVNTKTFPKYYSGLNYIISQQPDKTLEALMQMQNVDQDTIETHLTLGSIFRRRGELERAIRLHTGLLQRQNIDSLYKSQALLELARDYISAGVLDRAEAILLELIGNNEQLVLSLQHLLDLYQQGKEWLAAINIANKLQDIKRCDLSALIGHFYCELSEQSLKKQQIKQAKHYLYQALRINQKCCRAIILRANIEQFLGNYSKAIKLYKKVITINIDYLPLVLNEIVQCQQQSNAAISIEDLQAQNIVKYLCKHCGFTSTKLQWHCPSCKQWDVIKPVRS